MLQLYKYEIPFKSEFKTGTGTVNKRIGIILVYKAENITAYGEIAPLPGFSDYNLDEILQIIKVVKPNIETALAKNTGKGFIKVLNNKHPIPSLLFGLNTLFKDFEAKKYGLSFAAELCETIETPKMVKSNAVLGIRTLQKSIQDANTAILEGFDTIKLKLGLNFDIEFEIIEKLRKEFPLIKIRIDGNQSWSVNEAIANLNALKKLDIEYCEQPILAGDIDGLAELRKKAGIKIAADESVRCFADAEKIIANNAADILIIKPMMFGTFEDIEKTYNLAASNGVELVFTTSLEHEIGRQVTAAMAGVWGSKKYAHGLATGSLFKSDYYNKSEIENGNFKISEGLGLNLDLSLSNNIFKELLI